MEMEKIPHIIPVVRRNAKIMIQVHFIAIMIIAIRIFHIFQILLFKIQRKVTFYMLANL